jgi:hypothetical protein
VPAALETAPGSSYELFKVEEPGEVIGTIAIPVRDQLSTATTSSLLATDLSKQWIPEGKTVRRDLIQGGILTLQRNAAVQRMEGDWLLFIDDDMAWQPDAVRRLVEVREEYDLDMVGGLCFRRSPPFQPTLYMREQPDSGSYNFLEKWDSDVIEVDATGCAFLLIHKRVFERIIGMDMPPVAERLRVGPPPIFRWDGILGEDLRFCQDAKTAGCKVFVDTRIEIGHVSEVVIGRRQFLMEMAFRDKEMLDERRRINDLMGFYTMERSEAVAELRRP